MRRTRLLAVSFGLLAFAATPSRLAAQQPTPTQTARPGQQTPMAPRPPVAPVPPGVPGAAPQAPQGPPQAPPVGLPREMMASQNVKIDVAISDSGTANANTKRTVTILTAEGRNGRVRSQRGNIMLNVDAHPQFVRDGRIQLNLTIEYMPEPGPQMSLINESLSFLIGDGKPTVVSQAADPTGDRKVAVEVTATVLK